IRQQKGRGWCLRRLYYSRDGRTTFGSAGHMAATQLSNFLRSLRRRIGPPGGDALTDAELLDRWISQRDEAAFELLVRRHGPAVLGVCRRLLFRSQDIEDAFQATFLALIRKAGSIGKRQAVGSWLYKVAYHAALRVRAAASRHGLQEQPVLDPPAPSNADEIVWRDLRFVLDEEVSRLPEKLRVCFVLCCVEGLTHGEASKQLGCPEGTISSRLTRAREALRRSLTRRGLTLPAATVAAALSAETASASLPATLVDLTIAAGMRYAMGQTAAGGLLAARAIATAEGVLKAMLLSKLKVAAGVLLAIGVVGAGTAGLTYETQSVRQSTSVKSSKPPEKATGEGHPLPRPAFEDQVKALVRQLGDDEF